MSCIEKGFIITYQDNNKLQPVEIAVFLLYQFSMRTCIIGNVIVFSQTFSTNSSSSCHLMQCII